MRKLPAYAGWRLERWASIPSTSDEIIRRAEGDEPEGLAILAHLQTKGRGSRGREWVAPPGNLNLSVLLRPKGRADALGHWALLAGVAFHDALAAAVPGRRFTLKWPNDLLLDETKLGGILVESALTPQGALKWLAIGFGANLVSAPQKLDRPLASLEGAAKADVVAELLLEQISYWSEKVSGQGFAPVHAAWLQRTCPIGTSLSVNVDGAVMKGRFAGLSPAAGLQLEQDDGVHTLHTGEILAAIRQEHVG